MVVSARDPALDQSIALKLVRTGSGSQVCDDELTQRLLR